MCYHDEDINVTDREASISLQRLLMHTFHWVVDACDTSFTANNDLINCIFEGSWGFDASTGKLLYKRKFSEGEGDKGNCLFATTFIPLRIRSEDGFDFWLKSFPQSYRFCRPLRIQYRSENKTLILSEKHRAEKEVRYLSPIYTETSSDCSVVAHPKLYLTIVDGKVYNNISNTASL